MPEKAYMIETVHLTSIELTEMPFSGCWMSVMTAPQYVLMRASEPLPPSSNF